MLSFSLPKFLPHFAVKSLFILFMLLIAFQALSSIIILSMSPFLVHLLTVITCAPLVFPISFSFGLMSTKNLSLDLDFAVSMAMAKHKRGIGFTIMSLIIFMFPEMLSFENNASLLSSLTSIPP